MVSNHRIGYGLIKHDAVESGLAPAIEELIHTRHALLVGVRDIDLSATDIADIYMPDIAAGADKTNERLREIGTMAMVGRNVVVAVAVPESDSWDDTVGKMKSIRGKCFDKPEAGTVRGVFPPPRPANFDSLSFEEQMPYLVRNRFHAPDTPAGSLALRSLFHK